MDLILQAWGGGLYLSNKILFSLAEGRSQKLTRTLKLYGWIAYILGVPAWVIILLGKHNWIAASIETRGLPSMLLGLYMVYRNSHQPPRLFDRIASTSTYGFILLGTGYSLMDHGGITSLGQFLEIGVMAGFLLGSYLLAKNNNSGWLFFMVMNGSMATLMFIQAKPLLSIQQLISLGFVIYGYLRSKKIKATQNISSRDVSLPEQ